MKIAVPLAESLAHKQTPSSSNCLKGSFLEEVNVDPDAHGEDITNFPGISDKMFSVLRRREGHFFPITERGC